MDYSIKKVDECIKSIQEEVKNKPDFVTLKLDEWLKAHKGKTDFIKKYNDLVRKYVYCGENYLLAENDIEKFKGYYYLAAKAAEICYQLVEKGYTTRPDYVLKNLKTRGNVLYYVKNAILSNSRELAIKLATENSLLGAVLMKDYERAKLYLPEDIKMIPADCDLEQILWTIVYNDEKSFNRQVEETVKFLRRQARTYPAIYFNDGELAIIKLAAERGMTCIVNVAELPIHILDDIPVNEEEWKLPEDKELENLLAI